MHAALLLTVPLLATRPARESLLKAAPEGSSREAPDETFPRVLGVIPELSSMEEQRFPCNETMTPPELLEGPAIAYTPEARAARVEGTLTAKCVITQEGRVRDCHVTQSLAPMDAVVVEALHGRRYKPVTLRGEPVAVPYTFTVHFKLPR